MLEGNLKIMRELLFILMDVRISANQLGSWFIELKFYNKSKIAHILQFPVSWLNVNFNNISIIFHVILLCALSFHQFLKMKKIAISIVYKRIKFIPEQICADKSNWHSMWMICSQNSAIQHNSYSLAIFGQYFRITHSF